MEVIFEDRSQFAYLGERGIVGSNGCPHCVSDREAESFREGGAARVRESEGDYCGRKAELAVRLVRLHGVIYVVDDALPVDDSPVDERGREWVECYRAEGGDDQGHAYPIVNAAWRAGFEAARGSDESVKDDESSGEE